VQVLQRSIEEADAKGSVQPADEREGERKSEHVQPADEGESPEGDAILRDQIQQALLLSPLLQLLLLLVLLF
jgi:hypothetical protein